MKIRWVLFAVVLGIAAGCGSGSSNVAVSKQLIEYQVDKTTYAVVVPQDSGLSTSQAKSVARQRAAEMTVNKGHRYFKIVSEQEVQLLASDQDGSNFPPPTNLYQELIIEKGSGKESLQCQLPPTVKPMSGFRLVFQLQGQSPQRGSIDACKLTDCSAIFP